VTDATAEGTAHAGTQYTATSGVVDLVAGSASPTISVTIAGNQMLQGNRSFSLQLAGVAPSIEFNKVSTVPTGMFPFAVTLGDINGDGKPDLAIANATAGTVSVSLNATTAGLLAFSPPQVFATQL